MPRMEYRASKFPATYGPELVGAHILYFGWSELIWAAVSVGRAELMHLMRHGPFSAFEMVYRTAILFANLRETGSGELSRSAAYDGLDPSEKGAVSYFMGLTVAKLTVGRLLDVPWLMHLDVYREELKPITVGDGRPDLVGRNGDGQWIAVESKGRTNGEDAKALARAKEQVESLTSVKGEPIALGVAALAHFGGGLLQCVLDDPKRSKEKRQIDLPLSRERFFEGYYRPFREWLPNAPNARIEIVGDARFVVADLPEVDVSVGLREDMLKGAKPRRQQVSVAHEPHEGAQFVGADGILIRTGSLWSTKNMGLEPQERDR